MGFPPLTLSQCLKAPYRSQEEEQVVLHRSCMWLTSRKLPHWSFLQLKPIVKNLMDVRITKRITQLLNSPFPPRPPSISVSFLTPCKEKDDSPFLCRGLYVRLGLPLQNHLRLESEKAGSACCVRPIFCQCPTDAMGALNTALLRFWQVARPYVFCSLTERWAAALPLCH